MTTALSHLHRQWLLATVTLFSASLLAWQATVQADTTAPATGAATVATSSAPLTTPSTVKSTAPVATETATAPISNSSAAATAAADVGATPVTPDPTDITTPATTSAAPAELTNVVPGQPSFNIPKGINANFTGDPVDLTKVSGAHVWQGADYASAIPATAIGTDPHTGHAVIDEWMPDQAFQYFVYVTAYQSQYPTFNDFRANFNKQELSGLTKLEANFDKMSSVNAAGDERPTQYYYAVMAMRSLEGLQYAPQLTLLDIEPALYMNIVAFGTDSQNGNLTDISAVTNLSDLSDVYLTYGAISDISPLANKPKLTRLDLRFNQISDIRPLASDPNVRWAVDHQHLLRHPIYLAPGTTTYQQTIDTIKTQTNATVPVKPYNPAGPNSTYMTQYLSTATGGNVTPTTIDWSSLLQNPANAYGNLSSDWEADDNFAGVIIQPYSLEAVTNQANVVVVDDLHTVAGKPQVLQTLTANDDPTLAGTGGTPSTFNSQPAIDHWLAAGYHLITDGTKLPDGTSAIVFPDTPDAPVKLYTIHLGANTINVTIHYTLPNGQPAGPDQTVTGLLGDTLTVPTPPVVPGYQASAVPTDLTFTVVAAPISIAYTAVNTGTPGTGGTPGVTTPTPGTTTPPTGTPAPVPPETQPQPTPPTPVPPITPKPTPTPTPPVSPTNSRQPQVTPPSMTGPTAPVTVTSPTDTAKTRLPQTSEAPTAWWQVVGLAMLTAIAGFFGSTIRRQP